MAFKGNLRIDDIQGESQDADHRDEISVNGIQWGTRTKKSAQIKRGRSRSRPKVDSLTVFKSVDAATPYLALASMQGKSFDEIVLMVRKDSGEAHLDYLVITMTNCVFTSFDIESDPTGNDDIISEALSISFEKVKVIYTVQAEDHSAGDEHEIEYDIAAGV